MRSILIAVLLSASVAGSTCAQDAPPDLRGTWTGKGKVLIFGTSELLKGSPSYNEPPKVLDIEISHTVPGQDGNLAWGTTSSTSVDSKEAFAWAISEDGKTVLGTDTDGYYRLTLVSPDKMEKCYVHSGTSPTRSIVATCFMMERVRK